MRREIGYALAMKKPIIPLIFENTVPPIHIVNLTREDFTRTPWKYAIVSLLERLRRTDDDAGGSVTPPADPYREYLNALYKQIISVLKHTVFSEITLHCESTPDAITTRQAAALPAAFWAITGTQSERIPAPPERFESFQEAFEEFDGRILLLSEPGGGKTTTLLAFARDRVAQRLNSPDVPLPVIAPIATWNPDPPKPLPHWLAEQSPMLDRDAIAQLLDKNGVLLMCDGLDELGKARKETLAPFKYYDARRRFVDVLAKEGQLVVTCRAGEYAEIGRKVELRGAVTLKPLSDGQLHYYLSELPALLDALENDSQLREVVRTPLLLSIVTNAYKNNETEVDRLRNLKSAPGELRERIFSAYIQMRFDHEERKQNTKLQFDLHHVYEALGLAAVEGMDNVWLGDSSVKTLQESLRWSQRENAGPFIEQARQLNLIITDSTKRLTYRHQLLRDHFGFQYALRYVKEFTIEDFGHAKVLWQSFGLLAEIGDSRAIEPLLRHVESHNGHIPFPLVESLCDFGDPRIVLAYARTLSSHCQPVMDVLESEIASEKLVSSAQRLTPESSIQALAVALPSARAYERADYALALGILGLPDAIEALLVAARDKTPTVRGCAAWALGRIKDARAEEALRELSTDNCIIERDRPEYCPWPSYGTTIGELARMAMRNM